jgi:hypothetical protein
MFKRSVLLALCVLGVGLTAGAASAERASSNSFKFAFHFDRSAAPSVTYAKLIHDARRACNPEDVRTVAATQQRDVCVANVVEQAVTRIDMASLTSLHMAANGRPAHILMAQN